MKNLKKFLELTNEEWFWNKKSSEKEEMEGQGEKEEVQGYQSEEGEEIEALPRKGGGKIIEVDQEQWKDWTKIIPRHEQFEEVTFLVDENSDLTIYNPTIMFLSKDPKKPDPMSPGDENVLIRYNKQDNPHIKENILKELVKDQIIDTRHYMSLIKPEGIIMHCGNISSIVIP